VIVQERIALRISQKPHLYRSSLNLRTLWKQLWNVCLDLSFMEQTHLQAIQIIKEFIRF
jgi:hypothetical protein